MEPDLKLILDGDADGSHVEILVWSQVMSNASPYFQKLLRPNHFVEGNKLKSEGHLDLPLPETSAQGMQILCDIFHLNMDAIPVSNITSAQLFDVAVLADRFDCKRQLQLWSEKWLAQDHIRSELMGVVQFQDKSSILALLKWIWICQNLDNSTYLATLTSHLLKHHTAEDLAQADQTYIDVLPQGLIGMNIQLRRSGVRAANEIVATEKISEKRTQLITAFHTITLQFAELVEQGDTCRRSQDYASDQWTNMPLKTTDVFHCSSIALGNFLLAARAELGSDWRLLSSWVGSVGSTYKNMQAVAKMLTGTSEIAEGGLRMGRKNTVSHAECSLRERYSQQIEQAMNNINW